MFVRLDQTGPLYAQIYRAIRAEILGGRLAPGARLPSTRALASELGVSRNIAILAYSQLLAEGYLRARRGAGTIVASELPEEMTRVVPPGEPRARRRRSAAVRVSAFAQRMLEFSDKAEFSWTPRARPLPYDFRYARPSFGDFPYATWCRLLARRARRASIRELDYGPPEGLPLLRETIAAYLRRARGVTCAPEQVLILNGTQQALDLAARVLIEPGDRVVLEEPHYRSARAVLSAAGARVRTVAVDEQGLRVSELHSMRERIRIAFVTPSHQFPSGAVMPLARRLELLAWADRREVLLFEDDYDSEYHYAGRPLQALQGLDRTGRVLYAGTFSKLLFPSLRLGYLVLPQGLERAFRTAKALADTGSPILPQLVLADFIREGHFERHLRKSRTRYAARRDALLEAIDRHLGVRAEVLGANTGLHVVLWLRAIPSSRIDSIRSRAETAGVGVYPVAPFYLRPPRRLGLLIGYASLTENEIRKGIERLAGVLES